MWVFWMRTFIEFLKHVLASLTLLNRIPEQNKLWWINVEIQIWYSRKGMSSQHLEHFMQFHLVKSVLLQPLSCCFGGSTWSESRQGSAVWYSTWAMTAMTLIRCFSDALIADANKAWRLKFLLVWCCGLTCIWFPSRVVWYNWASNRAV